MCGTAQKFVGSADIPCYKATPMLNHTGTNAARDPSPLDNRLLGALPDADYARLRPDL